jgi:hypothetical protein
MALTFRGSLRHLYTLSLVYCSRSISEAVNQPSNRSAGQSNEKECLATVHQILANITPNIALWPGLDSNPLRSYLASLDKLERLNLSVALPGHRAVIHDVPGRVREIREHHRVRLQACWEAAGNGCAAYEVCLQVFPRLKNVDDVRMALVETLSHLQYLVGEGRLSQSEETGRATSGFHWRERGSATRVRPSSPVGRQLTHWH